MGTCVFGGNSVSISTFEKSGSFECIDSDVGVTDRPGREKEFQETGAFPTRCASFGNERRGREAKVQNSRSRLHLDFDRNVIPGCLVQLHDPHLAVFEPEDVVMVIDVARAVAAEGRVKGK